MNTNEFTKIFGHEGHEKRFEGLTSSNKSTDKSTGCYIVYDNTVFFEYSDCIGRLYHSADMPVQYLELNVITRQLKGI